MRETLRLSPSITNTFSALLPMSAMHFPFDITEGNINADKEQKNKREEQINHFDFV